MITRCKNVLIESTHSGKLITCRVGHVLSLYTMISSWGQKLSVFHSEWGFIISLMEMRSVIGLPLHHPRRKLIVNIRCVLYYFEGSIRSKFKDEG